MNGSVLLVTAASVSAQVETQNLKVSDLKTGARGKTFDWHHAVYKPVVMNSGAAAVILSRAGWHATDEGVLSSIEWCVTVRYEAVN